jgi:ATP-dependent Clp protease ATP-binding subunit ClpB
VDLNKFTNKSREALSAAQELAANSGHQVIGPKHLLAAMLDQEEGLAGRFLEHAGVDPAKLRQDLDKQLSAHPPGFRLRGCPADEHFNGPRLIESRTGSKAA